MTCVQGGGRPTHEHRIGNHLLQTRRGLQHGQQFRAGLGKRVSPRWLLVRKPSRHEIDDIRCDNNKVSRSRLSHRARLPQGKRNLRGPRSVLCKITRARHGSKTNTPRISLVPRCSPLSIGQRVAAGSHRAAAGPGMSVQEPAQATTLT